MQNASVQMDLRCIEKGSECVRRGGRGKERGECDKIQVNAYVTSFSGSKYALLSNGDLVIKSVEPMDAFKGYRCKVQNKLTSEAITSVNSGKVIVTGKLLFTTFFLLFSSHAILSILSIHFHFTSKSRREREREKEKERERKKKCVSLCDACSSDKLPACLTSV